MTLKHFKGLDELRALCALGVVVFHIESVKHIFHFQSLADYRFNSSLGFYGVQCFYVLSGFLVSFLLFDEKRQEGTISLSGFYLKRFLRIAPIYYGILFFAYFIFRHLNPTPAWQPVESAYTWPSLQLHLIFLPQVALDKYPFLMGASQLWTIGIEMQFYLIWPLLFLLLSPRPLLLFFLSYFGFYLYRIAFRLFEKIPFLYSETLFNAFNDALMHLQIRPMIVGAFAGWLLYTQKTKILKLIFHPVSQVLAGAGLACCYFFFNPFKYKIFQNFPPEPFLFAIVILNLCANPRPLWQLNSKFLGECGKFSYGIYIFHLVFVHFFFGWMMKLEFSKTIPLLFNIALYFLVFGSTLGLSYLSFHFIESPILKWGKRFTLGKG